MPVRRQGDDAVDACRDVFFGGDAAFGPKNIIWAVAHGHEAAISIDKLLPRRGRRATGPPPMVNLVSQKMGIHEWSYDNDISLRPALQGAAEATGEIALKNIKVEVELGFDAQAGVRRRRSAASTATCRRCSPTSCASSATPASTSARWTASPSPPNGDEPDLRTRLTAPARQPDAGPLRLRRAEDRPRDGQGRGRLPALRPVRRALPDRRLGHAEVPARHDAGGATHAASACTATPRRMPA